MPARAQHKGRFPNPHPAPSFRVICGAIIKDESSWRRRRRAALDWSSYQIRWTDLASSDFTPAGEPDTCLTQSAAESSMGVGYAPFTNQFAMNNGCEELSLLAADSQQSTGNDYPQAPGWTKRVRIGRASPCRVSTLCCSVHSACSR